MENLDRSKGVETVFRDFLTLCTCSLAQPFYRSEEIEQKYKDTIKNYTKEQAEEFPKLLAFLVSALEIEHQDFLGEVYMHLNLGSASKGQYFTPYRISKMMSKMTGYHVKKYAGSEIITLYEPYCGSGGMIIAFADALFEQRINYQQVLYVEATDIDELCYKMTFIQLSVLGIPAKVVWGDSLSIKTNKVLYTPFFFLGDFQKKLQDRANFEKINISETKEKSHGEQLKLFNF